jgi:hypothetical protein
VEADKRHERLFWEQPRGVFRRQGEARIQVMGRLARREIRG